MCEADHLLALHGLAALREMAARNVSQDDRARLLARVDPSEWGAAWAATHHEHDNATIAVKEPVVDALPYGVPPGRALDVGCGTGRHTAGLAAGGLPGVIALGREPPLNAVGRAAGSPGSARSWITTDFQRPRTIRVSAWAA